MAEQDKSNAERQLKELRKRAHRLAEFIELATRTASSPDLRREGARFAEVLEEWTEDLAELIEAQDAAAIEKMESFRTRIGLAEKKVGSWNLPTTFHETLEKLRKDESKKRPKREAA